MFHPQDSGWLSSLFTVKTPINNMAFSKIDPLSSGKEYRQAIMIQVLKCDLLQNVKFSI